jgi:hypothetical protein
MPPKLAACSAERRALGPIDMAFIEGSRRAAGGRQWGAAS